MEAQNTTYSDKIGLPPGSLVYIGKHKTQKAAISEINYSTDYYEENELHKFSDCIFMG